MILYMDIKKYQKLDHITHVLKRPGMYIGSVEKTTEELWVFDDALKKMVKKTTTFVPGFIKLFDEILTNAQDACLSDDTITFIKISFDKETGYISVTNNGKGIPIQKNQEHNLYIPEMIFGHLLSGSNYDDTVKRVVGGMHGLGSKCTNVFSKKFQIEIIDEESSQKYIQVFENNLSKINPPKITKCKSKGIVKITFLPDYEKFKMTGLDNDTLSLLKKRVIDATVCTNKKISIYLNDEKIPSKCLKDYCSYYPINETKIYHEQTICEKSGNLFDWEYAVCLTDSDVFEQISFVNGISTSQGGKHVDYILYQIINKLKNLLETKKKLKDVKPHVIKDRIFLFLKSTIVNPSFNSQTKEMLTTQSKEFGCNISVSDGFINKLYKSEMVTEIEQIYKLKEASSLVKTDGKKVNKLRGIPKLEDALWAGTNKSKECTLILTEGLSAMKFALDGRVVVGSEKYGIFALKGKVLNVRSATISQLMNNEEINYLKQIIGLKQDKIYKDTSELRYGKILLLTDADVDAKHIQSLLINFIHTFWPSLLKLNSSFIQTLKTPIVKVIKGKKILEFFTEQDYHKWQEINQNTSNCQIKYFKGLGTSTKEDAKNNFQRFNELKVDYYYKDKKCDESILLAFDKDKNVNKNDETISCTDKRKNWLSSYDKSNYINVKENRVSFQDQINKELIHFSIYDNVRSIPNLCDGLKPSQRKILYYMLNKNITKDIKVAQLSGYISAEMAYHHGETSLQGAIINMAQNFIGSNNINLLFPNGNFGSRYNNGSDSASPRYIFTRLSDMTNTIYDKNDLPLLNHQKDDGQDIEPEFLLPNLPMILINGCIGIGTGYSTNIPPYNPKDIIDNLKRIISKKTPLKMIPWFKGFNGKVIEISDGSYETRGKWVKINNTQIKITELPVGMGVIIYKEFLESLIQDTTTKDKKDKKTKIVLKDVQNKTTDENTDINFIIEFKNSKDLETLIENNLVEKELKLVKMFSTHNMYLFNEKTKLVKYNNVNDILIHWSNIRLEYYQRRKNYITNKLQEESDILNSKARFIKKYISGELDINKKSKEFVISLLEKNNFPLLENSYNYLLSLPISSLTLERINSLEKECANKHQELEFIKNKTKEQLWEVDLDKIVEQLS